MQVKLVNKNSKLPEYKNGIYEIYSGESYKLKPNQKLFINTGIICYLPVNVSGIILSGPLLESRNIKTQLQFIQRDKIKNLMILLKNKGLTNALIDYNDIVAHLILIKTEILKVIRTETFQEEYYENKNIDKKPIAENKIIGTSMLWFKKTYLTDPEKILKFIDHQIISELNNYTSTDEFYKNAENKNNLEAIFIWERLDNEIKTQIHNLYNQFDKSSPKKKKNKKLSESESESESENSSD